MATFDEIKTDIDARNPTKPGQYTGKPVPLNQREYQKPLSRVERLKARLEEDNPTDVEDIMMSPNTNASFRFDD